MFAFMKKVYSSCKNKAYRDYKKIVGVYCPYLKQTVRFNSKGFWHIIYRSRNKKRDIKNQLMRFKLLSNSVQVIQKSHTLQEYEKSKKLGEHIQYFGFIAIIAGWKIKVIVKKRGKGAPLFWSVIPNWITNKKRDRVLYKGNLEED